MTSWGEDQAQFVALVQSRSLMGCQAIANQAASNLNVLGCRVESCCITAGHDSHLITLCYTDLGPRAAVAGERRWDPPFDLSSKGEVEGGRDHGRE